jgi:hypothetical protein
MKVKEILKISGLPVLFASMCCLSPVIFFLLWITSLAAATELTDLFYGTYKWVFRSAGLLTLIIALVIYFRKKGICTLDQAKRNRNKIINTILITLITGVLGYIFFLYVVVHYIGVWLKVWE